VSADGISAAGEKLRHVPVSWAALWPAAACQYLSVCGTEIRAQGRVENSIRVGSVGRGYFETLWPQFVPPKSADQAIAKVSPFPAPTDCKSVDECVPRDGLKEVRATLEVDRIERNSK
jgi:hypothetical protein